LRADTVCLLSANRRKTPVLTGRHKQKCLKMPVDTRVLRNLPNKKATRM
jgi:hypothetical protein